MAVNIRASYAAEKLVTAYDLLASLTIPAQKRLAGALWEISMLQQHQDQLTDRGRELYRQIFDRIEGSGTWDDRIAVMSEAELTDIGHLIRDLFYETQSHYHGER
jgi:hypothetical protein